MYGMPHLTGYFIAFPVIAAASIVLGYWLAVRYEIRKNRVLYKAVIVVDVNGKPIQAIKALRGWAGYGLREAKEAIDLHRPIVIRDDLAKLLIEDLEAVGVSYRMTGAKTP